MSDFLPKDYEVPASGGNYMKFVKGENRFRILSTPILGFVWWNEVGGERKPRRVKMGTPIPTNEVDDPDDIKHFWAMVVHNYEGNKIQILEVTQKGIQKTLRSLSADKDWGSPVGTYDIVVTRSGDGLETKYEVLPKPAKPLDPGVKVAYEAMNINLEELFRNGDPFNSTSDSEAESIMEGAEEAGV